MKQLLKFIFALVHILTRQQKMNNEEMPTLSSDSIVSNTDTKCLATQDVPGEKVSSNNFNSKPLDVSEGTVRSRSPNILDDKLDEDDIDFSIIECIWDDVNNCSFYDVSYEQYLENKLEEAKKELKQELFDELSQKLNKQIIGLQTELQTRNQDYAGSRYTNIAKIILDIIRIWIELNK